MMMRIVEAIDLKLDLLFLELLLKLGIQDKVFLYRNYIE